MIYKLVYFYASDVFGIVRDYENDYPEKLLRLNEMAYFNDLEELKSQFCGFMTISYVSFSDRYDIIKIYKDFMDLKKIDETQNEFERMNPEYAL